jgi:hypothetical protein
MFLKHHPFLVACFFKILLKFHFVVTFPILGSLLYIFIKFFNHKNEIIMRKISLVLVAALLLSVGNVLANDYKPENPAKKIAMQIHKMLKNNSFDVSDDLTADVRFTINNEGEIVVLSVTTSNKNLEGFVKGRLNYKKVDNAQEGKIYTIPVRIEA